MDLIFFLQFSAGIVVCWLFFHMLFGFYQNTMLHQSVAIVVQLYLTAAMNLYYGTTRINT